MSNFLGLSISLAPQSCNRFLTVTFEEFSVLRNTEISIIIVASLQGYSAVFFLFVQQRAAWYCSCSLCCTCPLCQKDGQKQTPTAQSLNTHTPTRIHARVLYTNVRAHTGSRATVYMCMHTFSLASRSVQKTVEIQLKLLLESFIGMKQGSNIAEAIEMIYMNE